MKIRKTLHAEDGMILTNGEIYGRQISLAETDNEFMYYEITNEQYEQIMREQEEQALGGNNDHEVMSKNDNNIKTE